MNERTPRETRFKDNATKVAVQGMIGGEWIATFEALSPNDSTTNFIQHR